MMPGEDTNTLRQRHGGLSITKLKKAEAFIFQFMCTSNFELLVETPETSRETRQRCVACSWRAWNARYQKRIESPVRPSASSSARTSYGLASMLFLARPGRKMLVLMFSLALVERPKGYPTDDFKLV